MHTWKLVVLTLFVSVLRPIDGRDATAQDLDWIRSTDPIVEAKRAVASGDTALLCMNGYVGCASIPGVDQPKQDEYRKMFGVKPIQGTSDVVTPEVEAAAKYAEKYNRLIIQHSKKVSGTHERILKKEKV